MKKSPVGRKLPHFSIISVHVPALSIFLNLPGHFFDKKSIFQVERSKPRKKRPKRLEPLIEQQRTTSSHVMHRQMLLADHFAQWRTIIFCFLFGRTCCSDPSSKTGNICGFWGRTGGFEDFGSQWFCWTCFNRPQVVGAYLYALYTLLLGSFCSNSANSAGNAGYLNVLLDL